MFTMFEWMQSLDPAKVELERFAVFQTAVLVFPDEPARPPARMVSKKTERKLARERITSGLDLTEAQQRAVDNWLKGQGK